MSEILVVVEHTDGAAKKVTTELLTLARTLGEPSAVILGKAGVGATATAVLTEFGAAKIYVAESDDTDGYHVAPKVEVLAALVAEKSPAAVLVPSTAEGKEVAGRLAIKLGSGIICDAVGI